MPKKKAKKPAPFGHDSTCMEERALKRANKFLEHVGCGDGKIAMEPPEDPAESSLWVPYAIRAEGKEAVLKYKDEHCSKEWFFTMGGFEESQADTREEAAKALYKLLRPVAKALLSLEYDFE